MFIIIVFKLDSDKLFSCFFTGFLMSLPRGVTPRLGRVDDFSLFDYASPFCCLLIEFNYHFFVSYLVLTCYVYYYCI